MDYILSPSILSADFGHLADQMAQTVPAGTQYLHIDVMDGIFVPSISYGMPVEKSIRPYSTQVFDTHLMIEDPIRYVGDFAQSGADIITFHVEAAKDPAAVIRAIHDLGRKAGLAIKPGTPAEAVWPYLDSLDMVLVMTVEPGFGGQKYIPSCTEKIRTVREKIDAQGLRDRVDVEVDGGINRDTIRVVLDAGANVIVAGSAVFHGDIRENTGYFMKVLKEQQEKAQ